ncbi:unnamed protein product, partial [Oppiella nova]
QVLELLVQLSDELAKSSSSRFTDSKKYEPEFEKCFQIIERRSGEICNACVLLVKRWKKLPSNTTRNWHHVVDARAGPGTKSIKSKLSCISDNGIPSTTTSLDQMSHGSNSRKPHVNSHRKPKIVDNYNTKGTGRLNVVTNQIPSPDASDMSDLDDDIDEDMDDLEEEIEVQKITKKEVSGCGKQSKAADKRNSDCESPTNNAITSFLDMSFWKKEKICCGIIFKGPDNEVLIYPKLLEPCCCRRQRSHVIKPKLSTIVNSGSSDSGSVGSSSVTEEDANSNASSGNISLI